MQWTIGFRNDGAEKHRMDVIAGFVGGWVICEASTVEQPMCLVRRIKVSSQIVLK